MNGAGNFRKVAVVGATGAVGRQMLEILAERKFPIGELLLFASARSEGREISFGGQTYRCRVLREGCFDGVGIAFFDASDEVSKLWVPKALEAGAWVVDNSATFRLTDDVPLVVPEVNGDLILRTKRKIIAGPNCTVAPMVLALKPIRDLWGLRRVVLSTYQSVSGAGTLAMDELMMQTADVLAQKQVLPRIFPHQIAFNCIPHIGSFKDDGYTSEEWKTVQETRKILAMPELRLTATAVRVPTFSCHAESINIECERAVAIDEVRKALAAQAGVEVVDSPKNQAYPMGASASGRDAVYVGRIRKDLSIDNGLNMWVVSDNLRKGAALNAIQIGEIIVRMAQ